MHPSSTEGWESQLLGQPHRPARAPCTPPQRRGGSLNTGVGWIPVGSPCQCTPPQRRGGSLNLLSGICQSCWSPHAPLLNGGVGVSTRRRAGGACIVRAMHPSSTEGWESQPKARRSRGSDTAMHPSSTEGWESQPAVRSGGRCSRRRCTPPQRRGGSLNVWAPRPRCRGATDAPLLNGGVGVSTLSRPVRQLRAMRRMHPSSTEGWESQLPPGAGVRCRRRLKTRPMWRSRMRPRCCRVSSLPGLVF